VSLFLRDCSSIKSFREIKKSGVSPKEGFPMKKNGNNVNKSTKVGIVKLSILLALVVILAVSAVAIVKLNAKVGVAEAKAGTYSTSDEQWKGDLEKEINKISDIMPVSQQVINEQTSALLSESVQAWVDELVSNMISQGALLIDSDGNIAYNYDYNGLNTRFTINQDGLYINYDEVWAIFAGVATNTAAVVAFLDGLIALVWAAIGWIPVVGQVIATAFSIYILANMGAIVGGFVHAFTTYKGVRFYFDLSWSWFIPYAGIHYAVV